MVDKKSKDPFGTIRVARKALSKIRCFPHFLISLDMQSTIAPSDPSHLPIWIHRELQRGVPPPYGEQFSTLIKSASSKAFAATTEARIGEHTAVEVHPDKCHSVTSSSSTGPDNDPLRDGFQATTLDGDEVVRLLDACMRHQDHFNGFKVAAMVLLGTSMGFRGKMWCCCLLLCCTHV